MFSVKPLNAFPGKHKGRREPSLALVRPYLPTEEECVLLGQQLGSALLAVHAAAHNVSRSTHHADDVGGRPGDVEADVCVGDVGDADEGVEAAGDHGHPSPLALAVLEHPRGDAQEGKQGQRLVRPCEVTPQDHEAVAVGLGEHQNGDDQNEDGQSQLDALAVGGLVDVQRLRQAQTQGAQRRITGGDGQDDNADQGDDAAHMTQQVLADDAHGTGGQRCIGLLQSQVVHAHSAGSPDHGDEAFQHHHVVEGVAALTLALHGTGDDSGLGGVEAGQNAAGHRHEEDGQEVSVGEVVSVGKGAHGAVSTGQVQHGSRPAVPDVDQGHTLGEDADEHADGREQQDAAEDGVDLADDGIDGEHGGDQVVQEDHTVDDPGGNGSGLAVKAKDLCSGDVAGGVDEHSAHQQQHHAHKHVVELIDALGGVAADHLRHLGAAVAQADHAGEIVVHGAADDVADGDGQERDGPKEDALDRPDDGAGARDVQQVDEAVSPALHGDIVNAVFLGIGRRFAVVGSEYFLAEASVQSGTADQDDQTDDKCQHKNTLLCQVIFLFPGRPDRPEKSCSDYSTE